ncbi:MAG TPA: DoxX family protein [Terriglobia bacterium]|nr:DoxX family protein [Terriglobia bacterium]
MVTNFYPVSLGLLRVFAAFMFWQHGAQKLFGFYGQQAASFTLVWFVGAAEFLGAVAIALGILTRPFALFLALDMAVLYLTRYLPQGFPPISNINGEVACQLFLVASLLLFTGPGRYSIRDDADPRLQKHLPLFLSVFRIVAGLLFVEHGVQKLFGLLGAEPEPFLSLRWFAGVIETFGGSAITLGLFTRPVAFLASGEMAVAYFLVPFARGFWPIQNQGERTILFCYIFLFLWTTGPGEVSLDGLLRRKRAPDETTADLEV